MNPALNQVRTGWPRLSLISIPSRVMAQMGWLGLFCIVLAVLVAMPLVALMLRGFLGTDSDGRLMLTLEAVRVVLAEGGYWMAMWNTFVVSIGTMLVAALMGVLLAWCLVRTNVPWSGLLEQLAAMPIFIPPFIGAFAWVLIGAPRIGLANLPFTQAGLA
jgi:iron(III) transport system permease protein